MGFGPGRFGRILRRDPAARQSSQSQRSPVPGRIGGHDRRWCERCPALAQADLGIAIGAGSDVAVETADIILVRSKPSDVVALLELSKATYNKMIQNLAWATGYNAFAIPLAAGALYSWGVVLSPAVGAALMAASTVIVAINARLLSLKK
jgi:Cu2+-exporting ATPase